MNLQEIKSRYLDDRSVYFDERIAPVAGELIRLMSEDKELPYVVINGLKWDRENTTSNGEEYFTFDEAQELAERHGKRLPTKEEFKALADLGYTWDDEKRGMWFGCDHERMEKSTQSVFFPATGYRRSATGGLSYVGSNGYYWSGTPSSVANGRFLGFGSGSVSPQGTDSRAYGFAARCVAE